MKNEKITIYELVGLIKDNKAPKKINFAGDIFTYVSEEHNYKDSGGYSLFGYYIIDITNFFVITVEILPEENEMKEMIYQKDRKIEILYHGYYKDYEFYILNLGTFPTAYVNVCNNSLLNGKDYNNIDIDVHGGLTYSDKHLYINDEKEEANGWFIGWDYAHYNDYDGYETNLPEGLRASGKKWTTNEIYEEVKNVIEQCINYKKNDDWEDIEEIENIDDFFVGNLTELNSRIINKLIKNQKYLKEKLEDNTYFKSKVEFTGYIDEYLKGKLGNKNENL